MDFETCAFQGLILSLKLICFLNTGFEGGERSARRVPKKPRFRAPWAKFSIRPWGRGYHRMCFYFCFYTIGWPLMSNIFSLKCKKKVAELVLTVRTWREMTKTLKKFPKNTKNEKTRVFLWTCDFMIGFLLLHGCNCRWPPNMWRKINSMLRGFNVKWFQCWGVLMLRRFQIILLNLYDTLLMLNKCKSWRVLPENIFFILNIYLLNKINRLPIYKII